MPPRFPQNQPYFPLNCASTSLKAYPMSQFFWDQNPYLLTSWFTCFYLLQRETSNATQLFYSYRKGSGNKCVAIRLTSIKQSQSKRVLCAVINFQSTVLGDIMKINSNCMYNPCEILSRANYCKKWCVQYCTVHILYTKSLVYQRYENWKHNSQVTAQCWTLWYSRLVFSQFGHAMFLWQLSLDI